MSRMIIVNLPVQYAAALAVVMLVALCAAAAQEFAGREKLARSPMSSARR